MPRRRQRKTNRVPQDQRNLRVRGMRHSTPDAKKLSRAFIGLALARAEADARAQAEAADLQRPTHTETSAPGAEVRDGSQ